MKTLHSLQTLQKANWRYKNYKILQSHYWDTTGSLQRTTNGKNDLAKDYNNLFNFAGKM